VNDNKRVIKDSKLTAGFFCLYLVFVRYLWYHKGYGIIKVGKLLPNLREKLQTT